eukprot:g2471.t1
MLADKFQQYYCYEKFGKPWWETGLCYIISDNAWDCIDACLLDNGSVPEQEQALIDVLLIVQEMEQKTTEGWPLVEVTSDFRNNLFRQMQGAAAGMATTLTSIINTVQDLKKNELVRGAGMVTDLDSADLPLVTSATTDSKMPLGQSYLNLSQSNVYTQLNNMEKFVINVLEYYKQASLIDPNLSLGESQRLHYSMLYSNTFGSLSKYSQSVYFNKKYDTHVVSLPDRSAMSAVWDSVILVDWSHQDYNFRQSLTQKFDNYIFTQDGSDGRRYIIQTPYYQSDQSLSASLIVDLDASGKQPPMDRQSQVADKLSLWNALSEEKSLSLFGLYCVRSFRAPCLIPGEKSLEAQTLRVMLHSDQEVAIGSRERARQYQRGQGESQDVAHSLSGDSAPGEPGSLQINNALRSQPLLTGSQPLWSGLSIGSNSFPSHYAYTPPGITSLRLLQNSDLFERDSRYV